MILMNIRKILAAEIAKGLISTGVEGPFDAVSRSTAGDYPSMGCSQWEGYRGNLLLSYIDGGSNFQNRTYSDIVSCGELDSLKALLGSEQGQAAQRMLLSDDCLMYVDTLRQVPTLDDTRCFIYAGLWCPTSHNVVSTFLKNRCEQYNLRSLSVLRDLFKSQYYISAGVGEEYAAGYANRAEITYAYVAGIDLTTPYNIPAYGEAGNGR